MPYFDNNATTPLLSVAEEAFIRASRDHWHNTSSPYRSAAQARNIFDKDREWLAKLLGCPASAIVFNSGATEGNNAIFNFLEKKHSERARVVVSEIEHPSVLEPALAAFPSRVDLLPVLPSGVADLSALPKLLENPDVALVSLMAANNESGVLQPWRKCLQICRQKGIPFHTDASQWLGKMTVEGLGDCDYLTACAHKFGGPKGVGFDIISRSETGFNSQLGGVHEQGHRAGTENLPGIHSMVAALKGLYENLEQTRVDQEARRNAFEKTLCQQVPGTRIIGDQSERLWNTTYAVMPSFANTRWVAQLDKRGFIVSTGSACASGKEGPSHVLAAIGIERSEARRILRISGHWDTSSAAWNGLNAAFEEVWKELNKTKSSAEKTRVISV